MTAGFRSFLAFWIGGVGKKRSAVVTTPVVPPAPEVTFATWRPFAFRNPELLILEGEAKGAILRVAVTLIPGKATAGAKAMGAVLAFRAPIITAGAAIGIVRVRVSITEGLAEGLDTIAMDNSFLLELAAA